VGSDVHVLVESGIIKVDGIRPGVIVPYVICIDIETSRENPFLRELSTNLQPYLK
jgi:hypothetical protein